MRAKVCFFRVEFKEPQDVEKIGNDLDRFYSILDAAMEAGYIEDYNCSEMKEESDVD